MRLDNLSFIEPVDETDVISGSAGTTVNVHTLDLGNSPVARANAQSQARPLPNGGSLSISIGKGFARGTLPNALVETAGFGDIVVGSTQSTPNINSKPVDVATGVVVAITWPTPH